MLMTLTDTRRRPDMSDTRTKRVVLVAYDQMNLLDLTGPLQALSTATLRCSEGIDPLYETYVASVDGGQVVTSCGLPILTVALATLDDLPIDTLIVPGGCKGDEFYAPPRLVAWIARRVDHVRRLCSVCTGAFLLAATGYLDGRTVATHWDWVSRLGKLHPELSIDSDKIYVRDGSVWTSAGVTAGIDLTLALIADDYGQKIAIETARQLVMFIKRSGGQSQFSVSLSVQAREDSRFTDLHAWMSGHLKDDLRVERLAEQAGMSLRTFARIYAERIGRTPAKTVEAMRIEAACRSLEETELPLKAIAEATGHGDEQNLRRVFHRQLGISPVQYRQRFSGHAGAPQPVPDAQAADDQPNT